MRASDFLCEHGIMRIQSCVLELSMLRLVLCDRSRLWTSKSPARGSAARLGGRWRHFRTPVSSYQCMQRAQVVTYTCYLLKRRELEVLRVRGGGIRFVSLVRGRSLSIVRQTRRKERVSSAAITQEKAVDLSNDSMLNQKQKQSPNSEVGLGCIGPVVR